MSSKRAGSPTFITKLALIAVGIATLVLISGIYSTAMVILAT